LHVITKEWIFLNLFLVWNYTQMSKIEIKGILFHIFLIYKEGIVKFWKIKFIFQKCSPHFYLGFKGGLFLIALKKKIWILVKTQYPHLILNSSKDACIQLMINLLKKKSIPLVSSLTPTNNVFSCKAYQLALWKSLIKQSRLVLIWAPHKAFDIKRTWSRKIKFLSESQNFGFELLTWNVKKKSCYIEKFHLFILPSKKELHTIEKIKWLGSQIPCITSNPLNIYS